MLSTFAYEPQVCILMFPALYFQTVFWTSFKCFWFCFRCFLLFVLCWSCGFQLFDVLFNCIYMQHYKQTYSKSNFHNYISSCIQSLVNILIDIHVLLMLFLSSRGFSLNILKLVILIRWSQNINRVIISFNILQIIGNYSLDYCVFGGILISNNIIDFYLAVLFCVWEYLVAMSSFFFFQF